MTARGRNHSSQKPPQRELVHVNEVVRDMLVLPRSGEPVFDLDPHGTRA
jgi:hypothetical protein